MTECLASIGNASDKTQNLQKKERSFGVINREKSYLTETIQRLHGDGSPAAHLAPCIKDDFTRRYGYFLNFASRLDSLALQRPPAATVTPAMVEAYIADLESYATPVTVHHHIYKMMRVAEHIALGRPWSWLRRHARHRRAGELAFGIRRSGT